MPFVDDYLARIDAARPHRPDGPALRDLHRAHLEHVPFENLDVGLGRPVDLAHDALVAKIVAGRRGGFCYELNGLFGHLLAELGFSVTFVSAQVWTGVRYGFPLDHLALLVTDVDGGRWLCDVGFGAHSRHPLPVQLDTDLDDPDGTFRITDDAGDLAVTKDGRPQYRVDRHPRELADFAAMCWYQQHSPDSHFTQRTICSLPTADGRVSLSEDVLITTVRGERSERTLTDDASILAAYREHFGVTLERVPRLATAG